MLASILIFFIVLSVLILSHELGHFIVAKKAGVKVEEFGFGLPPRLFGKKIGETTYSINALPFGGFVRLHGEQEEGTDTDLSRSFLHKSKLIRSLVIIAGVVMNFILAIVIFSIVYSFSGIPKDTGKIKVLDVAAGSPAQQAGIVSGDVITKVNNESVSSSDSFIKITNESLGKKVTYEVQRTADGQVYTNKVSLTPRQSPPDGEGPTGVTISTIELYYPPVWQRPFYGIYYGFQDGIFWGKTIFSGLFGLVSGIFKGQAPTDISGPIGIYAVTTEASRNGFLTLLNFVGILSLNLGILNILPFPALDGGRLLFVIIEAITRKRVPTKVEVAITNIGFLILLILLFAITIGDVRKLIAAGSINGFINSLGK